MKRCTILFSVFLITAAAGQAMAQGGEYSKTEVYGGYSGGRFTSSTDSVTFTDPGGHSTTYKDLCSRATGEELGLNAQQFFCKRRSFNGFDGSFAFNVSQFIGIKGNISGDFKNDKFVDTFTPPGVTFTINTREHLYSYLGGLQFKDNGTRRTLKPMAHALFGAAHYTGRQQQDVDKFPEFNFTVQDRATSFAMKLGGGLDLRLSPKMDLRLIEVDYSPIFAGDRNYKTIAGPLTFKSTGKTANNVVFGAGIVLH